MIVAVRMTVGVPPVLGVGVGFGAGVGSGVGVGAGVGVGLGDGVPAAGGADGVEGDPPEHAAVRDAQAIRAARRMRRTSCRPVRRKQRTVGPGYSPLDPAHDRIPHPYGNTPAPDVVFCTGSAFTREAWTAKTDSKRRRSLI
jgi:hypothetical protein